MHSVFTCEIVLQPIVLPCVIVSPDELDADLRTFIVAPLTSGGHPYPFGVACTFQDRSGQPVLDQIRTVDRGRLVR